MILHTIWLVVTSATMFLILIQLTDRGGLIANLSGIILSGVSAMLIAGNFDTEGYATSVLFVVMAIVLGANFLGYYIASKRRRESWLGRKIE